MIDTSRKTISLFRARNFQFTITELMELEVMSMFTNLYKVYLKKNPDKTVQYYLLVGGREYPLGMAKMKNMHFHSNVIEDMRPAVISYKDCTGRIIKNKSYLLHDGRFYPEGNGEENHKLPVIDTVDMFLGLDDFKDVNEVLTAKHFID